MWKKKKNVKFLCLLHKKNSKGITFIMIWFTTLTQKKNLYYSAESPDLWPFKISKSRKKGFSVFFFYKHYLCYAQKQALMSDL